MQCFLKVILNQHKFGNAMTTLVIKKRSQLEHVGCFIKQKIV